MKIQLLIATSDQEYADALYTVLAKRQADIFELGLCSNPAKLEDMLLRRTYRAYFYLTFIRFFFLLIETFYQQVIFL